MKILFFINHLAYGGAERIASVLLNHLCEQHNTEVVLFSDKKSTYNINDKIYVRKIIVNGNNKFSKTIRRITEIKNTINETKPDLIISFLTYTNFYILLANMFLWKRIIVSERTTIQKKKSIWHLFTRHILYHFASSVVFVSQSDYNYAKWLKHKTFIYNPLCLSSYLDNNKKRENSIIAIGSQKRWQVKGFDLLIQAWSKIAPSYPKWRLQFIGTKDDDNISNMMKMYNLDNQVDFLGWFDEIDKVLQTKSIYALSSRNEGFPNSLIEAMSQGCACVAFDCKTGPNEIIDDGESGLLAHDGDVDDIADKLQQLIEDENLRHRLSKGAIEKANEFDKKSFFAKWDSLIDEVTEQ